MSGESTDSEHSGYSPESLSSAAKYGVAMQRLDPQLLQAVQKLHQGVEQEVESAWGQMLRGGVGFRLKSVQEITYSEFVFGLESPTFMQLLRPKPFQGTWLLELTPAMAYPMVERLLGGNGDASSRLQRPMTVIEQRLMARLFQPLLHAWQRAWAKVADLNLVVEHVESYPQDIQAAAPNDAVVVVRYEVELGGKIKEQLHLCLPSVTLAGLKAEDFAEAVNSVHEHGFGDAILPLKLQQAAARAKQIELSVQIAELTVSVDDLVGLKVGDIITTSQRVEQPLSVYISGEPKFVGFAGAVKGRKAVRLDLPRPEDSEVPQPPIMD